MYLKIATLCRSNDREWQGPPYYNRSPGKCCNWNVPNYYL